VTEKPNKRGSQRVSKRAANAASIECGYVQTNSKGEKIMNTYTNAMHPKKGAHRTARTNPFQNPAIVTIMLTLVAAIVVAVFIANRPAAAAENNPAVTYSNALEMQYARPWLEAQNRPALAYSNALEMQYAQPWLNAENKPAVAYGNALELQYAKPWLEAQNKSIAAYGNALELQYAQPWLDNAKLPIVVTGNAEGQTPLNCSSSMEMLYACKNGFGLP
jgi:hypothetical protein